MAEYRIANVESIFVVTDRKPRSRWIFADADVFDLCGIAKPSPFKHFSQAVLFLCLLHPSGSSLTYFTLY